MIKPIGLSATHMECRSLAESVPVLTDLLAFEKLAERGAIRTHRPDPQCRLGPVCARDRGGGARQTDA